MEIKINKDDLEKALAKSHSHGKAEGKKECKCNPGNPCDCESDEEIGFHKGALNTLVAERNELIKMIQNVEMIISAHLKRLEELGVKVQREERNE